MAAPEIAIAGRSNVGKSTLLNRLAGRKALARTSKTPGRTRGIVMFSLRLGNGAPLARPAPDRPARATATRRSSRTERNSWQPLIEGYTRAAANRWRCSWSWSTPAAASRPRSAQLYEWLGTEHVPAQVVYTKVDKLSATERGLLQRAESQIVRAPRADPRLRRERRGRCRPLGAIFEAVRGGDPRSPATPPGAERPSSTAGFVHAIRPAN